MNICQFTAPPMCALFFALAVLCGGNAFAQDWHQWGGAQRDFKAADLSFDAKTDFSSIQEEWRVKIGSGNSGICIRGEMAFAFFRQNEKEQVVAFSLADGREVWKRTFDVPAHKFMELEFGLGPHATPLVTDKLLFCVGLTGRLTALNVLTGETVWEQQLWLNGNHTKLERGCAASPVAFNDTIIIPVGGNGCSVRCFKMSDGRVQWQKHDFDCAYASPVVANLAGRPQAVLLMDQSLIGLDPENGELLWNHPVPTKNYVNCTTPVIGTDDTIYFNTDESLRGLQLKGAINQVSVEEIWSSRITICQTSNFVLREGVLYGAKEGNVFAAVDATNGQTLWQSRELKGSVIAAAGDHLFAVQENGLLAIAKVSPEGIDSKWRKHLLSGRCWVGPVVAHGLLLVRDSEKLIAFKLPK